MICAEAVHAVLDFLLEPEELRGHHKLHACTWLQICRVEGSYDICVVPANSFDVDVQEPEESQTRQLGNVVQIRVESKLGHAENLQLFQQRFVAAEAVRHDVDPDESLDIRGLSFRADQHFFECFVEAKWFVSWDWHFRLFTAAVPLLQQGHDRLHGVLGVGLCQKGCQVLFPEGLVGKIMWVADVSVAHETCKEINYNFQSNKRGRRMSRLKDLASSGTRLRD